MNIAKVFLVFSLVLISCLAQADSFNYSYTFMRNGEARDKVVGSFKGIANGNLVTGLSEITAIVNGIPLNGSGSLLNERPITNWTDNNAVASFDGTENNFFFGDGDFISRVGLTNYFFSFQFEGESLYEISTFEFFFQDRYYLDDNITIDRESGVWSLNVISSHDPQPDHGHDDEHGHAPVPEPSTMLLLGGGIAGLAFWRRKKSA